MNEKQKYILKNLQCIFLLITVFSIPTTIIMTYIFKWDNLVYYLIPLFIGITSGTFSLLINSFLFHNL